ncbi:MAG: hypothetical protein WA875_01740, partial [Candidatus Acidiferrales bacterium]
MVETAANSAALTEGAPPHAPEPTAGAAHWRAGFWSLIVTQFQNAFNDNGLKFLVIYIIVAMDFPKEYRDR